LEDSRRRKNNRAFVTGYAGGDFLENVYKIIIKKPSLYSFPEDLIKK